VEVIGFPVTYTGKPSIQVIARDISSRKHAETELIKAKEKAEESDRLKSAFLQNISHEIRTPLNAIIGFAALLNEPGLDGESRKSYTEIITQSSDQLLAIVIDIIEISNIQAGIFKLDKSELNLNSFMDNVFNQFNGKIKKNIKFTFRKILPDNESNILTDGKKLGQVLANLLSNAFKFTSKGKVEFGYTLKDNNIMFYVSDTGIGIAENHHSMIFDHFYQVEPLAASLYEGTGLGLSISKAYVELLGGKIWLRSEPGKGSVFYFTIPYKRVIQSVDEQHSVAASEEDQIKYKTLLIAEDDNNNYNLMKQLLADLNIKIIRASNGIEAVDICRSGEKIDMILMDIKMPLMDGYEATKQILEQSPEIKIIAQTAYSDDKEKALRSGCKGFISKPFDKNHLRTLVTEYL
jgi:CheY-like chemotaxis protein/nitrogen-specific signal transduction histidine kinase